MGCPERRAAEMLYSAGGAAQHATIPPHPPTATGHAERRCGRLQQVCVLKEVHPEAAAEVRVWQQLNTTTRHHPAPSLPRKLIPKAARPHPCGPAGAGRPGRSPLPAAAPSQPQPRPGPGRPPLVREQLRGKGRGLRLRAHQSDPASAAASPVGLICII